MTLPALLTELEVEMDSSVEPSPSRSETGQGLAERIVAVACRVDAPCTDSPAGKFRVTVTLPWPARHHSILWGFGRVQPDDQGFLTSAGRFVGRREAAEIAKAAGQVEKLIAEPDLYSEDLW